jgi:hypothetical protein
MAHGYLGDGYGTHGEFDPDRGDDRRGKWRNREAEWRDRDEGMLMRNRGRDEHGQDYFSPGTRGEDHERAQNRRAPAGDFAGRGDQRRLEEQSAHRRRDRDFSANPDDHYRSWRDRHMSELDRDYEDYCREREQEFHRSFNEWRGKRRNAAGDRADEIAVAAEEERTHERALGEAGNTPTPVGQATLGTNNSENAMTGRARGRS